MADEKKPVVPEPTVQAQPSPQQTASTLSAIAAQPAAQESGAAGQEDSNWFADAGNAVLSVGSFLAERGKAGLEAGMDESKILRIVGGMLGAESPSMRRAGLQEDLLRKNLALADQRLNQGDLELETTKTRLQILKDAQERQKVLNARADRDDARKDAVNATATSKELYGAYEEDALKQVMTDAGAEYFDTIKRETDTTLRTTDQFTPDAQVFEAMKGSRVVQEAVTTRAALAMLDSKNPIIQQAAVDIAKQHGIELSQQEGKWFMKLPGDGEGFELTERNRKWITAQLVGSIAQEAQAKTRMKQWEQHAVSRGFLVAANRLRNEAGMGDSAKQEEKISQIARTIPPKDLELYGALNTLKQLYDGGLTKEEIPIMDYQLEQLAAKFGIEHNGGDGGVFLIEGKNPVKYAEERLAQNPFQQALEREIQTQKKEAVRRLAQLAAEAAAKQGAGMGGEGDADAQAQAQFQETVESGRKLAEEMGVPKGFIENSVAKHNEAEEDDEKKITVGYGYNTFERAVQTFAASIADGRSGESAYKDAVKVFTDAGFKESDVPAVFRRRGREIDLDAEKAKTPALLKRVAEARKKYPAGVNAAKKDVSQAGLTPYISQEAAELLNANGAWDEHIDRIQELKRQQRAEEQQTAAQQAYNERFDQALQLLKGGKKAK